MRKLLDTIYAEEFPMGPFRIRQPLPSRDLEQLSPFILLHHAGPKQIEKNAKHGRIDPHPHAGFSPVTFVYKGEVFHRDSLGNEGKVSAGGVQWMNAGSGIVHSEGPSPDFLATGGELEMIQLWVNSPAAHKKDDPRYYNLPAEKIPILFKDNELVKLNLVAGKYDDKIGPAEITSPMTIFTATVKAKGHFELNFPSDWHLAYYVLNGKIKDHSGVLVDALHLAVFDQSSDKITLTAEDDSTLLILAGEAIKESLVAHGPFVMNSQKEIHEAIISYQSGKMGELDY